MMFNILGRGAEAMASANGPKQDFQIPQAKKFLTNALADNFELTDLQRDIANAIRDEEDLREFGRVADVIGEIEVQGRPAWVLIAKDLNRKQMNDDGEFTITGVSLAVDKTWHVQIGMIVEGVSKQGKKKKDINRFAIARIDRDYRPIQGTTALIPYESQMMVKFQLEDKKSQQELEQARKEYEKAKAELETLKSTGALANIAMGNMFMKQFEAMEQRLAMLEAGAKSDFDLKTMNAEKMAAVLNGNGAGDVRRIEYAKKGDLYDYLALLANSEIDRDALNREYAQWQAESRAREQAEARAESAKDAARTKELEELRKQNESEGQ